MPKFFNNQWDLPYPWPRATLGVWHKYPNLFATHVISMDVLDSTYDPETDKLRVERILGVKQAAPYWAAKILGVTEKTYVREVTMIDASRESFEMTSTNLNLSQYLLCKEYITYMPSKRSESSAFQPPGATTFTQRALIECNGLSGGMLDRAAKKIEDISFQRFGDNAGKGKQGLMQVCEHMWGQGHFDAS